MDDRGQSVTATVSHSGTAFVEVADFAAAKDAAQIYVNVDSEIDGCDW